jgi:3-oxoacyl-[acyl-carrier-protein] synthase II
VEKRIVGLTNIHISDYDCVTCFGDGVEVLFKSLLAKECGFKQIRRFETRNYVNCVAACVDDLDSVPHGRRFTALLEKLCRKDLRAGANAVLLTATTKDNIELLERHVKTSKRGSGNNSASPMVDFLVKRLDIKCPGYNVNTACTSASTAILWAAEMIGNGETDEVVVWAADIVSEFVFSGFSALKVMSPETSRPFDVNRDGLILGEAAGYVVLMSEEKLLQENKTSLGIIKSWGISSDAHHITAPDRQGRGLHRAIHNALKKASIQPGSLAAINGHGTGTVHNDAMEIAVFRQVFGDAIPPVYSIKGAIGHSLGPCGLIEVIVASRSLREKIVPPMAGLQTPEPEIDAYVTMESQRIDGRYTLTTNSGFGGINTALVIEKV